MDIKQKASVFAVLSALILSLAKFSVGMTSGSMAAVSSGLDSLLDVFMSAMNFFAIRKAAQPADESHTYGHGKAESIASSLQAMAIIFTGAFIIYKASQKLVHEEDVFYSVFDIGVMCLSLVFSLMISVILEKIGRKTESSALMTDALHYRSDLYSNSAAILAIILAYYTKLTFFDMLFAMLTGVIIIIAALRMLRRGVSVLMDSSVPRSIENEIASIIDNMPLPYVGYHKLRTRFAGNKKYIDFHLLACRNLTIDEAHELSHAIEKRIAERIKTTDITIHIEPCTHGCELNEASCTVIQVRKKKAGGKK